MRNPYGFIMFFSIIYSEAECCSEKVDVQTLQISNIEHYQQSIGTPIIYRSLNWNSVAPPI